MANTKLPSRLLDTSAIPALNVTGDLTVDTTTLKVDSTNNRVGIGIASPNTALEIKQISDDQNGSLRLTRNGENTYGSLFIASGGEGQSDPIILQHSNGTRNLMAWGRDGTVIIPNGNVGIGATTEAYHSDYKAIDINNSASVMGYTGNNGAWLLENLYYGTDGNWKHKNSDFSAAFEMYDGVFNLYNTASGTADATATLQNRLKIDASGNVGIGTAPARKLHLGGTAPGHSIIRQDATSSGTNWEIGERVAGKYQFWEDDGDNVRLTIMSSGNVGIGTDAPSETFVVSGDALVTGQMYLGPNTVSRRPFAKTTNWGYSTGYRAVVLGSASTAYSTNISGAVTLSFNYDPSGNSNGSFSGNGQEIIFRNGTQFVTPNAADDSWNLRNLVLKDGDVLIGSATNLNVLSGTPKLQIGSGTGHASLQFYSGATSVNGIYFGDTSSANNSRYSGYIEYRHNDNTMAFRASDRSVMTLKSDGPLLPAGNFGYHTTQEHYTASTAASSYSTASNITYNSSTQYWPDQGEKLICAINARAYTKYIHVKTNLTANNIMFYFRTKGYFYAAGCEEQLIGGYTYYSSGNLVISKNNETVAGNTHSGDTYRAADGSLVLKMDVNHTGYTEGKMLVFFHAHAPSTTSGITVTAVTQKDDGTNAF